ncbi:MAG: 50S ribosomal protein L25 [bacterium]|nr:50S ribosomal protein L25 [bacterium]
MPALKAEKREIIGKKVRNLRKQGKIPAVVYGAGDKGALLQIEARDFEKVFREAGESSLVELEIGQDRKNVLIHEVAFDPIKDTPVHVDFLAVRLDKPIRVKVPLIFEGESPAVKNLGGVLVKVRHELEVEALPKELPHEIKVDLGQLQKLEDKFMVSDLKLSRGVKVIGDKDEVLALAETPRVEEEVSAEAAPSLESIEVVGKKKEKEGAEEETTEKKETSKEVKTKKEGK